MTKQQIVPASTPVEQIGQLKVQLQALRAKQAEVTEESAYDQLEQEIAALTKAISLADARRRAEELAAAKEARSHAIAQHKQGLAHLEQLKTQRAKLDEAIMASLEDFTCAFLANYQLGTDQIELTDELIRSAGELGLDPPAKEQFTIAGLGVQPFTQQRAAEMLVAQYLLATAQIKAARSNGQYAPDKPGISWWAKGNGQFWPKAEGG